MTIELNVPDYLIFLHHRLKREGEGKEWKVAPVTILGGPITNRVSEGA
jgi:hypothetical protein